MFLQQHRFRAGMLGILIAVPPIFLLPLPATAQSMLDEVTVTSQRREQPVMAHAGNVATLTSATIAAVAHQHVHELMTRIAGTWISRGSGQEHLTAIRSPVLTGAGSCGGFLFLEDGIPLRPSGFCNVNQIFESNTEQARSIEVIRGPGSALYGSNALHGIVNILMPQASNPPPGNLAIEAGANQLLRFRGQLHGGNHIPVIGSLLYTDDGGFRDDSGYRQGKIHLMADWNFLDGSLSTAFSATTLRQQTAGFIVGQDAYRNPAVNRSNPNPEAFRDATSQRMYGTWKKSLPGLELDVRPYLRHSDMRFLQHFLPGQPLEENGHVSAGALAAVTFGSEPGRVVAGVDIEWSDMFLRQTQVGATAGSNFLRETRPAGKHYDYNVRSISFAPYLHAEYQLSEHLTLSGGLRLEYMRYDYRNRMLSGNTRDDGSACSFGGCLYSRPEDRRDQFTNIAPKFAVSYRLDPQITLFGNIARGFRAPQATELYRLQSGQQVADLDSERLDSIEVGIRTLRERWSADAALFVMRKRGSIFRDAEGFNISGGRSRHQGVEFSLEWQLFSLLQLELDASYARHTYDFNTVAARGETFTKGRDIDTAPRWLGSVELLFDAGDHADFGLQWTAIGNYYLDAENRFSYPGHSIINLRARIDLSGQFSITARLNNVSDRAIADRADYAFGNYRYFPGRGRELFLELRYRQ